MIVVTGSATARDEAFNEVRRLNLLHAVPVDCENPLRLVFFERWADRAALLTHFAIPPRGTSFARYSRSRPQPQPFSSTTPPNWKSSESVNAWLD